MQLLYINPAQLELDPEGVREDAGDVSGLAATIQDQGLLQPLGVIRLGGDRFRVVYGGRRQRAAVQLGLDKVPCIVLDADDPDLLLQQLIENVQRQELNDLEKARAFKRLRDQWAKGPDKLSEGELDERVGQAVGVGARTVRRYLGLLDLPFEVLELIRKGELSVTQAQHIRRINSEKTQIELAQLVADEGLSAAEVSQLSNYFAANPNLNVDTALQALASGAQLRTSATAEVPQDRVTKGGAATTLPGESDADLWDDEPDVDEAEQRERDAAFAAFETQEAAKTKARVFRIKSLDQMVDEADRLSRAYHEGDLKKWVTQDEGAPFKLRLLLKQLRSLAQAIEELTGDTVEV